MTLKNKSVIVIGGAGFIGIHWVGQIIEQNPEKIRVSDNFFLGNMKNLTQAEKNVLSLEITNQDIGFSIKNLINLIRKLMNYELEAKYEPERPGDVRGHKTDILLAKQLILSHIQI